MNTRNPLAAALLMAASTASAQFTLTDMNGGTPAASNPFSLANTAGLGAVDDIVFKCSRVIPYRKCEDAELKQREAIRASGTCPRPASPACVDYLMAQGEAAPVQLLGNQSNPSTANDEFFKKCGTVPYRLCTAAEEKQKAEYEAKNAPEKPVTDKPEVNDNIQGPPQVVDMPKGGPEGKMLQYPSGRVEYCYDDSCSKTSGKPMTPSEAEKFLKTEYADQKQLANSINSGGPSLTNAGNPDIGGMGLGGDTPGGDSSGGDRRSTPNTPDTTRTPGGNNTSYTPSSNSGTEGGGGNASSSGGNGARGVGADIGGDLARLSGDTGSSSSGGGGTAANPGDAPIVKVDGQVAMAEALNKHGYTYRKVNDADEKSKKILNGAASFNAESGNGRRDVDSTIGDGSNLGKIQAVAQ